MLFFIDGEGMETEESIKRFCFGIANNKGVGEPISCDQIVDEAKNILSDSGVENFEVFGSSSFYFVVLDVRLQIDISSIKTKLKEKIVWNRIGPEKAIILDRVFKKPPRKNRFTGKWDNHKRRVMTLEIKNSPALLEEYKEIHAKVWPQIIDNMDTMGIKDMEIYLHGYQAFLIMDTAPNFDLEQEGERWANLPREKEWQEYVAKFQKVDPKSKAVEKWEVMDSIKLST